MPEQKQQAKRLLNEAAQAFARLGYAGASVRNIAQAANINGAMIAYYFGSKEGLFRAVLEDRDAQIRERLTWAEKSAAPDQPLPDLRRRAYLNCVLVEFPEFAHIIWSHALLAENSFPNNECRQLATEHAKLLAAPTLLKEVAAKLLTTSPPLMDQPESARQALADKLAPTPKPRGQSNKRRAAKSLSPEPVKRAKEFTAPSPKDAGDDFLDGFLD